MAQKPKSSRRIIVWYCVTNQQPALANGSTPPPQQQPTLLQNLGRYIGWPLAGIVITKYGGAALDFLMNLIHHLPL